MKLASTVVDLLRERASSDIADKTFIQCGDEAVSYAALDASSDTVASGLRALGVKRGDRVATITTNRCEAIELLFACAKLGAVEVPINTFLKGDVLYDQLADSRAATIVADGPGITAVSTVAAGLATLRQIVSLDPDPPSFAGVDVRPYSAIRSGFVTDPLDDPIRVDDPMSIIYTSGTTGRPKGCVLPAGYYVRSAQRAGELSTLTADDVILTTLPMYHASCRMMSLTAALVAGGTVVIEDGFSASAMLDRLVDCGATVFVAVGAIARAMLSAPPGPRDRQHRLRQVIWVPSDPVLEDRFAARFGVAPSTNHYGQTECVIVASTPAGRTAPRGHAGRPVSDIDIRLVDDDDNEVAPGEVGELALRPATSTAMFAGYWGQPDATLHAFRHLWYHTGDSFRRDNHGDLWFVDRHKDVIRRRGENISSVQIESALLELDAVAEAAVHDLPSELTDSDIKACLVLKPNRTITPAEVFDFAHDRLPYYAVPRFVEIIDELPKNALSRILKAELRARGVTPQTWDLPALGYQIATRTPVACNGRRTPPTEGTMPRPPRPLLSRSIIIDGALAVIDEVGTEGFTTRKLATRLGVQAPSIYHYFSDHNEIFAAVGIRVLQSIRVSKRRSQAWTERLVQDAVSLYRAIDLHPNTAPILFNRVLPLETPTAYEETLGLMARSGVAPSRALALIDAIEGLAFSWMTFRRTRAPIQNLNNIDRATYPLLGKAIEGHSLSEREFRVIITALISGFAAQHAGVSGDETADRWGQ